MATVASCSRSADIMRGYALQIAQATTTSSRMKRSLNAGAQALGAATGGASESRGSPDRRDSVLAAAATEAEMCMSPLKLLSFRGLGQLRCSETRAAARAGQACQTTDTRRDCSRHGARQLVRLQALAAATSGFAHLLPLLDRRFHVVPAALELAQDAFTGHLALEMLDGTLDALVADLDLERFALNGFAGIRHGDGGYGRPLPRLQASLGGFC